MINYHKDPRSEWDALHELYRAEQNKHRASRTAARDAAFARARRQTRREKSLIHRLLKFLARI